MSNKPWRPADVYRERTGRPSPFGVDGDTGLIRDVVRENLARRLRDRHPLPFEDDETDPTELAIAIIREARRSGMAVELRIVPPGGEHGEIRQTG